MENRAQSDVYTFIYVNLCVLLLWWPSQLLKNSLINDFQSLFRGWRRDWSLCSIFPHVVIWLVILQFASQVLLVVMAALYVYILTWELEIISYLISFYVSDVCLLPFDLFYLCINCPLIILSLRVCVCVCAWQWHIILAELALPCVNPSRFMSLSHHLLCVVLSPVVIIKSLTKTT